LYSSLQPRAHSIPDDTPKSHLAAEIDSFLDISVMFSRLRIRYATAREKSRFSQKDYQKEKKLLQRYVHLEERGARRIGSTQQ
jgi:hypothetical protein